MSKNFFLPKLVVIPLLQERGHSSLYQPRADLFVW